MDGNAAQIALTEKRFQHNTLSEFVDVNPISTKRRKENAERVHASLV